MRVISKKRITNFYAIYDDSKNALETWYKIIMKSKYNSFHELRITFPGVDRIKNLFIFNICGNKYRLIAAIHFNTQILFLRYIFNP
ncbi:MAG TPA: hypothetical protein DC049_11470 [Spirochaetia bacterium]|nr:hypothetical protein [Spirochaetia bacterium]